jgi:hypothetical protein
MNPDKIWFSPLIFKPDSPTRSPLTIETNRQIIADNHMLKFEIWMIKNPIVKEDTQVSNETIFPAESDNFALF